MISLDTSVLARALVQDDPVQARAAATLMAEADALYVTKTVLLELEWVLRHAYGIPAEDIHDAFTRLAGLERLRLEDETSCLRAIDGYGRGMDFADALHLASSSGSDRFASFDRRLASAAIARTDAPEVLLLPPPSTAPQG